MNGYGKAFTLMRDAAQGPWRDYTRHAFVEGMKDGTLPREAFLHYLRQDYVFLIHFSRAWALAVVKSETHSEMLTAVGTVNALVAEEMQLHIGICEAAGISQDELFATPERAENLAYTRFVLEAGYSGDLLDLLAALAPCVMGYGEIGARLAEEATSETYRDWINTYAGEEYQGACQAVGELLDSALTRRLGGDFESSPRWDRLCQTFRTATELEVNFWQMGLTP
ncbi:MULTISPECIES: thiaminase II [unclassified Ruegeria]|uniref:thiaminase II n=1 Tax=unclassified Ruegeria TaxID=2625375 RepID=UPI001489291C|nr:MULTISPECIES: thiaminase II [unclassified Ruegeria]NOD76125.1 thiaminase II [Ruegeria sp. HKCCD4332]NOD90084.1 thiaminase II [Ruegeria sp. HKCCD4318]NOE15157.1 thiaminase II [Ruegeria sp. HKCCD4318-2]NOG10632.1 thiaminase II [Ruegeria sp. HKCCD4315]